MLRHPQSFTGLSALTAILLSSGAHAQTADWDGGTDLLWSTATNWLADAVPAPGSILRFGTAAATLTATTNDTGGTFDSIEFTGTTGGFSITSATPGANALQLANGIRATHGGSPVSIASPLQHPAKANVQGAAFLQSGGARADAPGRGAETKSKTRKPSQRSAAPKERETSETPGGRAETKGK